MRVFVGLYKGHKIPYLALISFTQLDSLVVRDVAVFSKVGPQLPH